MATQTSMTFEQIIKKHSDLITKILDNTPGSKDSTIDGTPEQFIEQVMVANYRCHPEWPFEQEQLRAAHAYLSQALFHTYLAEAYTVDPPVSAVLLGKADECLANVNPDKFDH